MRFHRSVGGRGGAGSVTVEHADDPRDGLCTSMADETKPEHEVRLELAYRGQWMTFLAPKSFLVAATRALIEALGVEPPATRLNLTVVHEHHELPRRRRKKLSPERAKLGAIKKGLRGQ